MPPTYLAFVYLPEYLRATKRVLSGADHERIEQALCRDPNAGAVIKDSGGVRKMRISLGTRGKSGGGRVIYAHHATRGVVYLISFNAKNARSDITSVERRAFRRLVKQLEGEQ